jgi:hypothetical protein
MLGSVAIVSPTNGAVRPSDAALGLEVALATPNPPIVRVDYFRAGLLVASETNAPFGTMISNPPTGTNTFQAVAADSAGLSWTSAPVSVVVLDPGVTIIAPADRTVLLRAGPVAVSAATLLPAGSITNVRFFANAVEFARSDAAPFTGLWSNAPAGVHRLTAAGLDDMGQLHFSASVFLAVGQTLVPTNAVWRYLDNGTDPGTGWAGAGFDDTGWSNGPAQLGYGDGDEATVVSFGPNSSAKYTTTFFRHGFPAPDPAGLSHLVLRVRRDDGAVFYRVRQQDAP